MQPEEFRRLGHQLIDWIAEYRARVADLPVMPTVTPGSVRAQLPTTPPDDPQTLDGLLAHLDQIVLPGVLHWQHPQFFGFFPANAPLESVLGDLLSSGLRVLGLSWQASPALSEIEEVMTERAVSCRQRSWPPQAPRLPPPSIRSLPWPTSPDGTRCGCTSMPRWLERR